jgi:ATP-dependent Lon protease
VLIPIDNEKDLVEIPDNIKGQRLFSGCLAQLVERRPYKANVGGSTPSAPTTEQRRTCVRLCRI